MPSNRVQRRQAASNICNLNCCAKELEEKPQQIFEGKFQDMLFLRVLLSFGDISHWPSLRRSEQTRISLLHKCSQLYVKNKWKHSLHIFTLMLKCVCVSWCIRHMEAGVQPNYTLSSWSQQLRDEISLTTVGLESHTKYVVIGPVGFFTAGCFSRCFENKVSLIWPLEVWKICIHNNLCHVKFTFPYYGKCWY